MKTLKESQIGINFRFATGVEGLDDGQKQETLLDGIYPKFAKVRDELEGVFARGARKLVALDEDTSIGICENTFEPKIDASAGTVDAGFWFYNTREFSDDEAKLLKKFCQQAVEDAEMSSDVVFVGAEAYRRFEISETSSFTIGD